MFQHSPKRPTRLLVSAVALIGPLLVIALLFSDKPPSVSAALLAPTNLQIVALDSSFHVNWTPSTDSATAWHVVSVWDGTTLLQSKIVGKTSGVAQTNDLVPGHSYTVKVQAMDSAGNLSAAISKTLATDPQSPMRNAAFFENFNAGPAGALDPDYFDVRTSDSVGNVADFADGRIAFNNEHHFHTQLINADGTGGLYIRSRVPFDFTGRTGTMEFEVDMPAAMHAHGKWWGLHLVRDIPSQQDDFGNSSGSEYPNEVEFAMYDSDESKEAEGHNLPLITVNIGGNLLKFTGTTPIVTPPNVRVPVVVKISQTSAEMFVNGVSVLKANGFTLPFTKGYWLMLHKNYGAEKLDNLGGDVAAAPPTVLQLLHWDMWQFDGPAGSYSPVARTYIQPGCDNSVDLGHNTLIGCPAFVGDGTSSNTMRFNIADDVTKARSAQLLFNGGSSRPLSVTINGHTASVPVKNSGTAFYDLNVYQFPTSWLVRGNNTLLASTTDGGSSGLAQFEVEVIFDIPRQMPTVQPEMPMPMLSLTAANFRVDQLVGQSQIHTLTTNLYSMGGAGNVPYTVQMITTNTPWLTVSPASGNVSSVLAGGKLQPLTLTLDFSKYNGGDYGSVAIVKINGGHMPLYLGVLAMSEGRTTAPSFVQTYPLITTFNKAAIPDYHGAPSGTLTPTPANSATRTATVVGAVTPTLTRTRTATRTRTRTATRTATRTVTRTATRTRTRTVTRTATRTATAVPNATITRTRTRTATRTPTTTRTRTRTITRTPTATPVGKTAAVYTDNLAAGWENWSWGAAVTLQDGASKHAGSYALSCAYSQAWGGLYLHNAGFNTGGYGKLTFFVSGGASANQQIALSLVDSAGNFLPSVDLGAYINGGSLAANTWRQVTVPLSALAGANRTISGVVLQDNLGGAQPRFYVDDMKFVGP